MEGAAVNVWRSPSCSSDVITTSGLVPFAVSVGMSLTSLAATTSAQWWKINSQIECR